MPGCREEATQDGVSVCGMGWLFEVGRLGGGGGLHQEQGKTQLRSQSHTQLETITGIM